MTRRRIIAVLLLLLLAASTVAATEKEEIVAFNIRTLKYHCRTCSSARACTRNCIEITISDAKSRGGAACKRCGGRCR